MPVTDEMLRNPPPGDWLMARRNYQAWSYSPLTEITRDNVKDLQARLGVGDDASRRRQPDRCRSCTTASIYLVNPGNIVQALDGRDRRSDLGERGRSAAADRHRRDAQHRDLRGQAHPRDDRRAARRARRAERQEGLGDGDRRSRARATRNTSGPIVARGKVIQGLQGCARYGPDRCFISAYDANTGKQLWKFHTIAHTGEPGGDTWGKLPGHLPRGRRDLDCRQLRSRSRT